MGRLVDWKGVDITIAAVGLARKEVDVELDVLGDGPERPRLEAVAAAARLQEAVRFLGFHPQRACVDILGGSVAADWGDGEVLADK